MLTQVLKEIVNSRGGIRMKELSRKMGVEESALEGMVEYWVHKGRIRRLSGDDLLCAEVDCDQPCPYCAKKN
jgi:predicted transcriptional regulator